MSRIAITRRDNEGFVLHYPGGPTVYVGVKETNDGHGRARIYIDAPPTVSIHREELALEILRERLDEGPLVATSEEDCEAVRECRWLIDACRAIHQGESKRQPIARRLLDRLAGLGLGAKGKTTGPHAAPTPPRGDHAPA